jgi:hypothetical protein
MLCLNYNICGARSSRTSFRINFLSILYLKRGKSHLLTYHETALSRPTVFCMKTVKKTYLIPEQVMKTQRVDGTLVFNPHFDIRQN